MTSATRKDQVLLRASGVGKRFGALVVLEEVDVELRGNEILGIVGPNGAGKTTLLDVMAGAQTASGGRVELNGRDVTSRSAATRCRMGIGRSHQVPRPFGGMTVFENVLVGAVSGAGLRGSEGYDRAIEVLDRCQLLHQGNRSAESLGLLDRKRLELARAMATDPVLLLLDEIAAGLTEAETEHLVETIEDVRRAGIACLWIEHIVRLLTRVADRMVCLAEGRVIADGAPSAVMADPAVMEAYLGTPAR